MTGEVRKMGAVFPVTRQCETVATVAVAVGITVPPNLHLAEQCHAWTGA